MLSSRQVNTGFLNPTDVTKDGCLHRGWQRRQSVRILMDSLAWKHVILLWWPYWLLQMDLACHHFICFEVWQDPDGFSSLWTCYAIVMGALAVGDGLSVPSLYLLWGLTESWWILQPRNLQHATVMVALAVGVGQWHANTLFALRSKWILMDSPAWEPAMLL